MTKNFQRTILYEPETFQGLNAYHLYFFQEIIHIKTLFQDLLRNYQSGRLLRANVKAFRIKIVILLSISDTPYNEKLIPITSQKSGTKDCGGLY